MFKFLRGLASKIATKPIIDGQFLLEKDSGRLLIDDSTTRVAVRDTSAAKSLTFTDHTLTLKDADGNTLSSVNISNPTYLSVNVSNGHLYYSVGDDITLIDNVTIPGNLTVNGVVTVNGS